MSVTYIGVRHHSPACARLVAETIRARRPAYVLIEGPSDFNERIHELFLGHTLPIALFSSGPGTASFSPFCEYSPEWAALEAGRAVHARTLFIDLPAWHPAFAARANRYADAELRYTEAMDRLGAAFQTTNSDALWDTLFEIEIENTEGLARRLATYFELLRGESAASEGDQARETHMAQWVRAAEAAAGDASVVVVTGGFHMPAIRALAARPADEAADDEAAGSEAPGSDLDPGRWPAVPAPPPNADGAAAAVSTFLVPYSYRRLDAFTGYQSGMPSPEYYRQLWEAGPEAAASTLLEAVAARLRGRNQPVSTADLIAARTQSEGLAALRGHGAVTRSDLLDGLASALVSEDLDQPLPWSRRGALTPGAHPAVVEMVSVFSGSRVGRLHPKTPAPPLVHDVAAELERVGLGGSGPLTLHLTEPADLERSRVLHRLSVLGIPGYRRESGPAGGLDPVDVEEWTIRKDEHRRAALIEAGARGSTLAAAATAVLEERAAGAGDVGVLSVVLFDAVLCGLSGTADRLFDVICTELGAGSGASGGSSGSGSAAGGGAQLGRLGQVLATSLGLWRHDRIFRLSGSSALSRVIAASAAQVLWAMQAATGPSAPADPAGPQAVAALRDAVLHAEPILGTLSRGQVTEAAGRVAARTDAPPDVRGAGLGLLWSLGGTVDAANALPGGIGTEQIGDWLSGLFILAREQAAGETMVAVLDRLVAQMSEDEFLIALPSLRMAFAYFPPRERAAVAQQLLERRGLRGSAHALLRSRVDPAAYRRARTIETNALPRLSGTGLLSPEAEARLKGLSA